MRRCIVVALLLCASRAESQDFRVRVTLPGWSRHPLALDTVASPMVIDAPKSKVFAAYTAAMDELKIPIQERDLLAGTVGNAAVQARYNFAGFPMSRLVGCGLGAFGPNANSYRIHIALMAIMDSIGPTQTRVRMAMAAGAYDPGGAAKEPASCESTGVLEEKITEGAKRHLKP
jgi:hypothetical protein